MPVTVMALTRANDYYARRNTYDSNTDFRKRAAITSGMRAPGDAAAR